MFDQEFAKWLGALGVGGAIAYIVIKYYDAAAKQWREEQKQWLAERKEQVEQYKTFCEAMSERYTRLLKETSEQNARLFTELLLITKAAVSAMTENTSVLRAMHERVDNLHLGTYVQVIRDAEAHAVGLQREKTGPIDTGDLSDRVRS